MKFGDHLMPVYAWLLTYQHTTTVTQPCASTLETPGRGKSQTSNPDDLLSKTQMSPWHSVFSPSQVLWGIIIIQLSSSWGTSYHIIKGYQSYWHKSIMEDRLVPWYHSRCPSEMSNSRGMWILLGSGFNWHWSSAIDIALLLTCFSCTRSLTLSGSRLFYWLRSTSLSLHLGIVCVNVCNECPLHVFLE